MVGYRRLWPVVAEVGADFWQGWRWAALVGDATLCGVSFDPKGQRIPAQGATLRIGWWACIRDRDGGYGCDLKERPIPFAPKGQRIPAQGATLGIGRWGCNPGDWNAGMHPGPGRWACIRDTDGGHSSGTRTVGMHPEHGWWVWRRAGLGVGAVRHMIPRASPWVVKLCPVGAGIREGSRRAAITFQPPPMLSCHEHRVPCAPLGQEWVKGSGARPRLEGGADAGAGARRQPHRLLELLAVELHLHRVAPRAHGEEGLW